MSRTVSSGRLDGDNALRQCGPARLGQSLFPAARALRSLIHVLIVACGCTSALGVFSTSPAVAQCSQSGNVETCTGNIPGPRNFDTSSGVNDLEINNVTTGPSQASLRGTGTQPSAGTAGVGSYSCSTSDQTNCTINNGVQPPTCTVNSGAPSGTTCVSNQTTQPGGGPTGNSGPTVAVKVAAPTSGPVTVGGSNAGNVNPPVAVVGISVGSQGGTGGHSVFTDGGTGGNGVDGGNVTVTFTGQALNVNQGGILAQSVGGGGGTGGGSTFAGGGQGGEGGFGGEAIANFAGGSISTLGDGNNGVTSVSQGGNGGAGGNGGITFIYSIGGPGNNAGQAGEAQVSTAAGTTIST